MIKNKSAYNASAAQGEKTSRVNAEAIFAPAATLAEWMAHWERAVCTQNRLAVGELLDTIGAGHLGERQATAEELLRVAQVGVVLFLAVVAHRDATPGVLEEARSLWGSMVDAGLEECDLDPDGGPAEYKSVPE